ncbi:RNA polymerase sigma-70 factor [Stackebrandtia nassauensis]|uniref:RNA polymerase, sigma-24 subunit, ECF subfamily n=1 Tax=Stackebrandtia nassauensis (strain DSM 44728 / CIP 108903 / NRRL B-16338 / NBRC 102104 / LLR-40K-21) TaxID=446470 RepID=D3PYS1_STANL|nr:RNA polymerase sigma-70 factor [Stackebrandtia nassauensis]ADD43504.1 RNA polymerase, sigma-24 subunit, ECF subfamily [Stackebrandtia nassauensis DSM 44728]
MATATELFEQHRNLLFSVAYRMLGSAADAEDVVQDSWLKWSAVDLDTVDSPKAYLVRIASNTALNRLKSAQVQRESYVGPWLPEPILTSPDIAEDVEMADSVSMAMLVVLESLTPEERAVFVLREVFGFPHTEIASALDRPEASVRQLAHRARSHVQARRPRFDADREKQKQATEEFLSAAAGGDINRLMEILAPDAALWTDGGGKVKAPLRDIHGAHRIANFFVKVATQPWQGYRPEQWEFAAAQINGANGVLIRVEGKVVTAFTTEVLDGRITAIHLVGNPDKLAHLDED